MTISIKSIGSIINESPSVTYLKTTNFNFTTISIEYKLENIGLAICRHYLYLNGEKKEITKEVGYESNENIFKYQITELKADTIYTIQIEINDGANETQSKVIQQSTKKPTIYGVKILEDNSNPFTCATYIEKATGMSSANSTSLGEWENKWPFNKIRIVGFKNGKVVKEIKKENKKQYIDGTSVLNDVDVMIEVPKIYWKFTNIENGYELRISNAKIEGSDCYAHKVGGVEKDFIYVGAYLGHYENGKLRSRSGVSPTTDTTLTTFRTYANNAGNGYQQLNWFTLMLLQILYLITYKNLNSQAALGQGISQASKNNTGGADLKGFVYGSNNQNEQICFLGIEDFYGNVFQSIDGIYCDKNYNILINNDNKDFSNNTENIYKHKLLTLGSISKVHHTNKSGFLPLENTGSSSSYYSDRGIVKENSFLRFGGSWSFGTPVGAFCFYLDTDVSSKISSLGSRLVYLG